MHSREGKTVRYEIFFVSLMNAFSTIGQEWTLLVARQATNLVAIVSRLVSTHSPLPIESVEMSELRDFKASSVRET
jgi:hypothetical protein